MAKKAKKKKKKKAVKEEPRKPINDAKGGYPQEKVYPTDVGDTRVRKATFKDSKDMLKKTGKVGTIHPKRVKVIHPKKGKE